jgi:hypothetical protein
MNKLDQLDSQIKKLKFQNQKLIQQTTILRNQIDEIKFYLKLTDICYNKNKSSTIINKKKSEIGVFMEESKLKKIGSLQLDPLDFVAFLLKQNEFKQNNIAIPKNNMEGFTNLRIQKLLYFIEGVHIVEHNKSLFDEEFEA